MLLRIMCAVVMISGCADAYAASATVERIRKAGILHCGIDESTAEYSMTDEHGSRVAFDRDICKAIAAALAPAMKVDIKSYPDEDTALAALRAGDVDLIASVSDTLSRASTDIAFSQPVLYDGASFLVKHSSKIEKASDLSGKKICFLAETEVEVNLRTWFAKTNSTSYLFLFKKKARWKRRSSLATALDWRAT